MANKWNPGIASLAMILVLFYSGDRPTSNTIVDHRNPTSALRLDGMEPQAAEKIRRLRQEADQNPKAAAAWGKLGMTIDVHGLKEESIPCYQLAADLDPKDFRWPYYCAIALKEMGSPDAFRWFQKGTELNPGYVPQQIRYARAFFDAGKLDESEKHFRLALQTDPNSADAYVGLAQIAISHDSIQAARDFAVKAAELNSRQVEAFSLLAIIYRRLHDAVKATQVLAMAGKLPDKTALIDPVYAALVSEGESAFWYRTRGRTYMDAGLYLLATREFQTALRLHEDADAYDNLGAALQGLGRWEEAVEYHKQAIAMNPGYLKYYNLGIAYGKMGRYPEAIDAFQNSVHSRPDYAEAYYNLGVAYFKLSKWREAIENLKLAIQRDPEHTRAHHALDLAEQYRAQASRLH